MNFIVNGITLLGFFAGQPLMAFLAPPEERFVGVLDFRPIDASGPPGSAAVPPVQVHSNPDAASKVLSSGADLLMMEIGYEENGAVVFERRPAGWSLVRFTAKGKTDRGWIQDVPGKARFVPLARKNRTRQLLCDLLWAIAKRD